MVIVGVFICPKSVQSLLREAPSRLAQSAVVMYVLQPVQHVHLLGRHCGRSCMCRVVMLCLCALCTRVLSLLGEDVMLQGDL